MSAAGWHLYLLEKHLICFELIWLILWKYVVSCTVVSTKLDNCSVDYYTSVTFSRRRPASTTPRTTRYFSVFFYETSSDQRSQTSAENSGASWRTQHNASNNCSSCLTHLDKNLIQRHWIKISGPGYSGSAFGNRGSGYYTESLQKIWIIGSWAALHSSLKFYQNLFITCWDTLQTAILTFRRIRMAKNLG